MIQLAVLSSKTSSSTKVLMSTRSIKNTNDTSRNYMVSYLSYCAHNNNNKALFSSFDELQVYFIGLIRLCSCCQNDYIFSQRFMRTPYMRYRLVALQIPFWQFLFQSPYFLTQNFCRALMIFFLKMALRQMCCLLYLNHTSLIFKNKMIKDVRLQWILSVKTNFICLMGVLYLPSFQHFLFAPIAQWERIVNGAG